MAWLQVSFVVIEICNNGTMAINHNESIYTLYSRLPWTREQLFGFPRARLLPCASVLLRCTFARLHKDSTQGFIHAYNATYTQGSDRTRWSQKVTLSKAIRVWIMSMIQCFRVRAFFFNRLFRFTMLTATLYCLNCRITTFETLKDESLSINIFAANNCFSDRNIFQNDIDTLSKIDDAFLTKRQTFHLVRIIWLCSNFASLWHKHLLWNYK